MHESIRSSIPTLAASLVLLVLTSGFVRAEDYYTGTTETSQIQRFTTDEMRALVAPIALYPDALIAQILPASTFPLQVVEAYRYTQTSATPSQPPASTSWDSSVIALLNYPTALKKLNDDPNWTERLGYAVTYQMADVTATIQQVRAEAQAAGNLVSNDKQTVVQDESYIQIVPTNPQVIYVPVYEPEVIFVRHDRWEPYISFGTGFGFGIWLGNRLDWRQNHIYQNNHWGHGGWYGSSRPDYWRPQYRPIPQWYQHGGNRPVLPTRPSPTRPITGYSSRPPVTPYRPVTPNAPVAPRPQISNRPIHFGEGFGDSRQDVIRDSNRGQTSRQPLTRPAPTPIPRPIAPTPQPYTRPSYSSNPMRPSSGASTNIESQRGAASRRR